MKDILEYKIECLAMAIINRINEINEVDVDIRQKNNDECFDYAISQLKELLRFIRY